MELNDRIRNPNSTNQSKTTTTALEIFAAVPIGAGRRCDNEFCPSSNPWPLHHVPRQANFGRLCTSCVLRHHRGFFCSACLEVFDSPPMPIGDIHVSGIARCSRCPAVAHSSCLTGDSSVCNYICPLCEDPEEFSYFAVGDSVIDAVAARALLSASRIAAASMSRGAAAARLAAERKMKMASEARKMAKEMLERVVVLCKKRKDEMEGKGRMKEVSASGMENGDLKVNKKKKKKKKKRKMMISLSTPIALLKKC